MTLGASILAFLLFMCSWLCHPLLFHKNSWNFLILRSLPCHTRLKLATSQKSLGERWHGRISLYLEWGLKELIACVSRWNSQGVESSRSCDVLHRHSDCKEFLLFCTTANYLGLWLNVVLRLSNLSLILEPFLLFPRSSLSQIKLCDGMKSRVLVDGMKKSDFSLYAFLVKLNFQRMKRKWFCWSVSAFLTIVFEPSTWLLHGVKFFGRQLILCRVTPGKVVLFSRERVLL